MTEHKLTTKMNPLNYQTGWYEQMKPNYQAFDDNLPEYWLMKYVDRAKMIRDVNPEAKTMLDIGCGLGRAMRYFEGLCFDVWGVEPSEYAFEHNQLKSKVWNNYFDRLDFTQITPNKFDVIYIEQALSHIPDWKGTLDKAYKLLNPNGVILIEEPNDDNELQQIIEKEKGKYWVTKDHCNYFNLKDRVLHKHLEILGCKIHKVTSTFPMEFFQLMGIEYIGSEKLGKMVHRMRFDLLKEMGDKRLAFKESMAKLGWGRDLVLVAQK